MPSVSDGAYLVDLSHAESMKDVFKTIIKELAIDCLDQERNSLLKNPFLQRQRCVLVFENIREDSEFLLIEFICFLKDLTVHTEYLKIILVIERKENLPSDIEECFSMVEVGHLTRDQAVDHLLSLLRAEDKLHLITDEAQSKEALKQLDIINVWQKKDFRKEFAREIIRKLGEKKSLRRIAEEVQVESRAKPRLNPSEQHLEDLRACMIHLKQKGHTLFNDMLSLVALIPDGICLSELKIVGAQMVKLINKGIEAPNQILMKDVDLYVSVIKEISQTNLVSIQDGAQRSEEDKASRELLKKELMTLARFETREQLADEIKIRISKDKTQAIIEFINLKHQIQTGVSHFYKEQLFALVVNFYTRYAMFMLFKLHDTQDSQNFDNLTIQSADLCIDLDSLWSLWFNWLPMKQDQEHPEPQLLSSTASSRQAKIDLKSMQSKFMDIFYSYKLSYFQQRFEENRANLVHLIKESTLLELWPQLRD